MKNRSAKMKRANGRRLWLFKALFCMVVTVVLILGGNCSQVFATQLTAGASADGVIPGVGDAQTMENKTDPEGSAEAVKPIVYQRDLDDQNNQSNPDDTDNTDNTGDAGNSGNAGNAGIEAPAPISTSEFIMVGGDWITPVATYGRYVNVVLPLVNMSTTHLNNVIVTPVIASDTAEWPFEIETSGYTQTIPDLPGKGNGQNDMDRRRELTWTFKVRGDVLNGYYKVPFNVIYYANGGYETTTVITWVKAVGAPGSGNLSDGGSGLSTPRVIITGFDTVPANVYAGDTFTLTLHLKNTSKRTAVSNMQIDLTTPTAGTSQESSYEAFLPTSGSNTLYIESISPNGTADISIEMTAKADLSQKPYAITVNMDYEDSKYSPYSATANVSIPVNQEPRFDIGSMEVLPSDISVGGQSNVMFSIFNTGKVTLNNVQVKFEGDSISGGDTFIGKIEPGMTGNVDAMISGEMATMDEGMVKAVIYYENDAGDTFTREEEFYLYVYEEFYEDDMMFDGDMMFEEEQRKSPVLTIVILVIILVIAAIITTVIIIKKKKKKKELLELEAELEEEASGSEGNDEV